MIIIMGKTLTITSNIINSSDERPEAEARPAPSEVTGDSNSKPSQRREDLVAEEREELKEAKELAELAEEAIKRAEEALEEEEA